MSVKYKPQKSGTITMTKPIKCLTPVCENAPWSRGLCSGCYSIAWHCVKEGKVTWLELQNSGKILPRKKAGKKVRAWFTAGASVHDD